MIAFAIYILWDGHRQQNKLKLLFLIPIAMSALMFPPFITMMSEKFFMVYRMLLILSCFAVITIYFISMRRKQTTQVQSQRAQEAAAKAARQAKQRANNHQKNKGQHKKK